MTGGAIVLDMQELSGSRLELSLIPPHIILHPEFEELGAGWEFTPGKEC
jgi:hypothetical protein